MPPSSPQSFVWSKEPAVSAVYDFQALDIDEKFASLQSAAVVLWFAN